MSIPSPTVPPVSPPTSEARHTPGPWTAENHRVFSNIHDLPTLRHITTVTYQRNDAETYANARLIASAPDLLAAAEAALPLLLLAAINAPDRECAKRYSDTCSVVTAAIKAAKGGVA